MVMLLKVPWIWETMVPMSCVCVCVFEKQHWFVHYFSTSEAKSRCWGFLTYNRNLGCSTFSVLFFTK